MDVKEVALLLGWKRDTVLDAIRDGVLLPVSRKKRQLAASGQGSSFEISDAELQEFLDAFESEQPGRHPPVLVRRELRTEAQHKCGICRADLPLQFHHILEWNDLKHHDPAHMIAVCGGCHDKINAGQIDRFEQRKYKRRLQDALDQFSQAPPRLFPDGPASPLSWHNLRDVLELLHEAVINTDPSTESQFDFTLVDLDTKNKLNKLGEDTFAVMRDKDEPFFGRIQSFLENPLNSQTTTLYHEVVDEIRRRVAAEQSRFDRFEDLLEELYHAVRLRFEKKLRGKGRTLRILTSFMYFNCDIGRKE